VRSIGILAAIAALAIIEAPASHAQEEAQLVLSAPPMVRGPIGWVQVAGRIASGSRAPSDLVIAIDVSESAFLPAGVDVDGDGVVGGLSQRRMFRSDGSRRPTKTWTTDPGDTVFELSRVLARRILESIGREDTRVGLVTFSETTKVRARLGSVERTLVALDGLRTPSNPSATHIEAAIRVGQDLLTPWVDDGREKILLVISDGRATRPGPPIIAVRAARRAAIAAAREGVEIHSVAVGPDAMRNARSFTTLAALTDGNRAYRSASDWRHSLLQESAVELPLAEVAIANETLGLQGRAVRFFPDGSFDGFVRLAPGANRLSIQARASDGTCLAARHTVYSDPDDTSPAELDALRELLRTRALEIQLAGAARRGTVQRRLEIDPTN